MMSKIKVLYVVTKCTKCGPINVLLNIVESMDMSEIDFYLITTDREDADRSIINEFQKRAVEHIFVPLEKKMVIFGNISDLKKEIQRISPDVIHSTGIVPDLAVSRICPDKQLIISHANVFVDNKLKYGKIIGAFLAQLNIYVYKQARLTIACSKSLSELYRKHGMELPYIRNGVRVGKKERYDKTKLRNELGLPVKSPIFVYAAAFIPRKNHRFIIEMFKCHLTDCTLLLLGDGPLLDEMTSIAGENTIFAGRQENVMPYVMASDYCVSSSFQEGMPMAVLEAMSCGLPVLLSDISQHRELFELGKDIGCLFVNGSQDSFEKACREIIDKDYQAISESSYEIVRDYFNAEKMSAEYQLKYKAIAKNE